MWHVWGRGELHTEFWWGNLTKRDHLEDIDVYGKMLKNGSSRNGIGSCTGLIWLGIGIGDAVL
jgi:hypothetical protein